MTIFTDGLRQRAQLGISEIPASLGETLGVAAGESYESLPLVSLSRMGEIARARGPQAAPDYAAMAPEDALNVPPPLTPEQDSPDVPMVAARQKVKEAGLEGALTLPETPTVKSRVLDIMIERARERREREATLARGPSGFVPGALQLSTSFLVQAVDPINIGAAFVPVVGPARYGRMLAAAGESVIGRAAVRGRVGAVEGAVGMAAIEPLEYARRTQEGQDYTMADSLRQVAFGAVLGAGLHAGGGAVADALRARRGKPVYPFAAGEPFERSVASPGAAERAIAPEASAARGRPETPLPAPARAVQAASPEPARQQKPQSLLEFIAARGGVSDADPLVADLLQSFGGKNPTVRGKGKLVRGDGLRLDRLREAAVEAGYLDDAAALRGDVSDSTINDLLEAVDAEARGRKVYPRGEAGFVSKDELAAAAEQEAARLDQFRAETLADIEAQLVERGHDGMSPGLRGAIERKTLAAAEAEPKRSVTEHLDAVLKDFEMPVALALEDLPPRAKEDALRASIAGLVEGEPVRAGELLQAAAESDPRIAESLGPLRSAEPTNVDAAWRDFAESRPEHSAPETLAAFDEAKALPEPAATAAEPDRAMTGAEEADNIAADLWQQAIDDGRVSEAEQARLNALLEEIDQAADTQASLAREGAACLTAGFAAMGVAG